MILLLGGRTTERKLSGALLNVRTRPEITKAWMEIQIKPILLQQKIINIGIHTYIMIMLTP